MSHFQKYSGLPLSLFSVFKALSGSAILRLNQPLHLQPRLQVPHCFGRSHVHMPFVSLLFPEEKSQIYRSLPLNGKWKAWGQPQSGAGRKETFWSSRHRRVSMYGCTRQGELGCERLESRRQSPKVSRLGCVAPSQLWIRNASEHPSKSPDLLHKWNTSLHPQPHPPLTTCLFWIWSGSFVVYWGCKHL